VDIQFTDSISRFGEMWNFIKSSLKCSQTYYVRLCWQQ